MREPSRVLIQAVPGLSGGLPTGSEPEATHRVACRVTRASSIGPEGGVTSPKGSSTTWPSEPTAIRLPLASTPVLRFSNNTGAA